MPNDLPREAPLLKYDFEESAGYWVCMTAHVFQRALNVELSAHGITYRQWQVLAWLAHDGCLSQSELADRMDIEPATLVSVLARMQRNGWIRRDDCPSDRRKRLVRPTPEADEVWQRGAECARRVRQWATEHIAPEQLQIVKELLASMRENVAMHTLLNAQAANELTSEAT